MYFPESEVIAREHNDLRRVVELIDLQLATIFSSAPLRATDFACIIDCDPNQVDSVFDLLAGLGVLRSEAMVECERCQNLMPGVAFRQAIDDEDRFECSSCGHPYRSRSQPILIYRMTSQALSQPKPELPGDEPSAAAGEEPLGVRAQEVLVAMLNLGAIDSDTRRSTEEIASEALGSGADANSLKSVMADLNTRKLIETKTGRNGGCWLTKAGHARAEKLRNQKQ